MRASNKITSLKQEMIVDQVNALKASQQFEWDDSLAEWSDEGQIGAIFHRDGRFFLRLDADVKEVSESSALKHWIDASTGGEWGKRVWAIVRRGLRRAK